MNIELRSFFLIGLGSALGGMARYACVLISERLLGTQFPWGTILVNLIGSLVIGLVAGLSLSTHKFALSIEARQFIMLGLCGGFTTFSSFSLQTLLLIRSDQLLLAGLNLLVSVGACLIATALGMSIASQISSVS